MKKNMCETKLKNIVRSLYKLKKKKVTKLKKK